MYFTLLKKQPSYVMNTFTSSKCECMNLSMNPFIKCMVFIFKLKKNLDTNGLTHLDLF